MIKSALMYKYIEISLKKAICLLFGLFLAAGMYAAGTVNLNFFVGRDKILTSVGYALYRRFEV